MNETEQLRFRIAVALKVCNLFREALQKSGNRYHGGLVPNLTSITDCLTLPFGTLMQQVELTPEIRP